MLQYLPRILAQIVFKVKCNCVRNKMDMTD